MYAQTLKVSGASRTIVLALTLLLASCIFDKKFEIGVAVSGLTGTGLVLQNNGGDNLAIPKDGYYTFSREVKKGKTYNVTVLTQPTGQTCTVANGSGTAKSNVSDVAVTCTGGASFTVGGSVSGLTASGLVLRNNGGNDLTILGNGPFTFSAKVASGAAYSVTVFAQPAGQACSVSNGSGTANANVTNVAVTCVATSFTVGGTVSGVTGPGLVLQNNGGNNLAVAGDGPFTFSTSLPNSAAYSVSVFSAPAGEGCTVANGSGTISGANVSNVAVTCVAPPVAPAASVNFGVKELQFSWGAAAGATFYRLLENPDGASGYNLVASNITALSYNHAIPVHQRLNAQYVVDACNAGGCTSSNIMGLGTDLVPLIGYVKASNTQAGDQFGYSVAVSGDGNTFAVGSPFEDSSSTGVNSTSNEGATSAGAVYVYSRVAGTWQQQAYVKASDTAGAFDFFGISVSLSGDGNTLAVGAYNHANTGAVYVYARTGGNWAPQQALTSPTATSGDGFGIAVSLSGDGNTLAIGTPGENTVAGSVHVFTLSGGSWSQQGSALVASNSEPMIMFGSSVALSSNGNTLAVGANGENSPATGVNGNPANDCNGAQTNCAMSSGAAYVFARSGATWSQQAYVKASNTAANDQFGNSVALSGDGNTLAVGSPFEDSTATDSGAAYVFTRSGTNWSQQALVKASNAGNGDQFGWSVTLSGDGNSLAVGAPFEDSDGAGIGTTPNDAASDAGAAYFYVRNGASWSQKSFVKASNTDKLTSTTFPEADTFGTSVALSNDGNTLVVGAQQEDGSGTGIDNPGLDNAASAGAAYLY